MRYIWFALLVWTPLLVAPVAAKDKPAEGDLEKLQGCWDFVGYEDGQKKIDNMFGKASDHPVVVLFDPGSSLCVQKSFVMFSRGVELVLRRAEIRLDASKNPRAIDVTFGTPKRQKTFLGIYKLEADKWTLCVADGDRRPTEFKAKPGQAVLYYARSANDKAIRDFLDRIKKK
jgi:uncharacterized protein (TIGR03067 family)